MNQHVRSRAQIDGGVEHRLDDRLEQLAADDQSLLQLIAGVEHPQADLGRAFRADDRRRDTSRGEAERRSDRVVAAIADLRIQQFDPMAASRKRMAERDEWTDVAFAAPGLYPDPHAPLQ